MVVYIHLGNCYSAYCKEITKGTLTKQTLTNYFRSNSAYIGPIKSMRFRWTEAEYTGRNQREDGSTYATMEMVEKALNSSAYAFNYDTLCKLFDIDYERDMAEDLENRTVGSANAPKMPQQMTIEELSESEDNPFAS